MCYKTGHFYLLLTGVFYRKNGIASHVFMKMLLCYIDKNEGTLEKLQGNFVNIVGMLTNPGACARRMQNGGV